MNIREVAADIKTYQRLNRAAGSGGSVVSRVGATVRAVGSGRAKAYLRTSDPPGPMPLTIRSAPVVVLLVATRTPAWPGNGVNEAIWANSVIAA